GLHQASRVTGGCQSDDIESVGVREAEGELRASRQEAADGDALPEVVEHRGPGAVVGHVRRPAEVAQLWAGGDGLIESDKGDVLRIAEDGVGELADALAVSVRRDRPLAH